MNDKNVLPQRAYKDLPERLGSEGRDDMGINLLAIRPQREQCGIPRNGNTISNIDPLNDIAEPLAQVPEAHVRNIREPPCAQLVEYGAMPTNIPECAICQKQIVRNGEQTESLPAAGGDHEDASVAEARTVAEIKGLQLGTLGNGLERGVANAMAPAQQELPEPSVCGFAHGEDGLIVDGGNERKINRPEGLGVVGEGSDGVDGETCAAAKDDSVEDSSGSSGECLDDLVIDGVG